MFFFKVVGDTIYNLLEIGEAEVGEDERPLYPIKINSVEVLSNPFDDIEPRTTALERKADREAEERRLAAKDTNSRKIKGKKNLNLLSFGDEAENEEISIKAIAPNKRKIASSHDLLTDDQRLSKEGLDPVAKSRMPVPAPSSQQEAAPALKKRSKRDEKEESESEEDSSDDEMEQSKASHNAKLSSIAPSSKLSAVRSEVAKLQNELRQIDSAKRTARATEAFTDKSTQKMNPLESMRNKYKGKALMGKRLKSSGEDKDILNNLAAFKDKILNPDESVSKSKPGKLKEEKVCSLHGLAGCRSCVKYGEDDDADDDDSGWFAHELHFKKDAANVYEPTVDDYSFFDPRNPQASDEKKRAKDSGSRDSGGRGYQQRDVGRSSRDGRDRGKRRDDRKEGGRDSRY
ncbi:Peptidyl-prolyl isomerase cwc27 [Chytriomyces hyalinus]|nr:Peptidyl-prolyl isomerase cwc27 [Chytriomyces hyalinus]